LVEIFPVLLTLQISIRPRGLREIISLILVIVNIFPLMERSQQMCCQQNGDESPENGDEEGDEVP
jgi:hypothetical protein